MNTLYKSILVITFSFFCTFANAQGAGDKIFHTLGYTLYADYFQSPVSERVDRFEENGQTVRRTSYYRATGFSYFTFIYRFRYNVAEVSDNFAVGLSASPSIGVGLAVDDIGGGGVINIPFMLSAEFGAGSTYNSAANMGGFFGAGLEYTKFPLIVGDVPTDLDPITAWTEPVIAAGVRYWSKNNRLREITLKYGFGKKYDYRESYDDDLEQKSAMTLRLAFLYVLNY